MATRRVSSAKHGDFTLFYRIASPFSNFHPCSFEAKALDDSVHRYNCSEQFYMYNKALFEKDSAAAARILKSNDPKEIKAIGSKLTKFRIERWKVVSKDVMRTALRAKFSQDAQLLFALFLTHGSRLVECAPRDRLWGIGLGANNPKAINPSQWRGKNQLGAILDEVRKELWNDISHRSTRKEVEEKMRDSNFAVSYFSNYQAQNTVGGKDAPETSSTQSEPERNSSVPVSAKRAPKAKRVLDIQTLSQECKIKRSRKETI